MDLTNNDKKLQLFLNRRNMSKHREQLYKHVLKDMHEISKLTPSELIDEGRKEQQPDWENKTFIGMEDRKITQYIYEYYDFLKNTRKNSARTIKEKLLCINAFYDEFQIETPKPITIKEKKRRTRKKDIPSWDDVKNVLEKLENLKYKALVLFIATSGLRVSDVIKLTINDFLEATKEYHDGTLENLLQQDPSQIVPSWDIDPQKTEKEGNLCITFNTPECVEYIFNYLNQRIEKGYSVNKEEALFRPVPRKKHSRSFYRTVEISEIFRKNMNSLIGNKIDKHNYIFFRAHNLRKLFITTCSSNIGKAMFEVEEKTNKGTRYDLVALFAGHTPSKGMMTETYEAIEPEDVKPYYIQLIPYLTIKDTEVHHFKSEEYKELEKKFEESKNRELKQHKKQQALEKRIAEIEAKNKEENKFDDLLEEIGKERFIELLKKLRE